jgi:gluconate 2-dehydrogenase gamma chain
MSEITRREVLHRLALTIAAAGTVDRLAAQEAHRMVRQAAITAGGRYAAKALSPHEFVTLQRLTDLIIPAENDKPGAAQADVAAWIDTLLSVNPELRARYSSGLAWIDQTMAGRGAADFVTATAAEQTDLLDLIAYQRNRSEALNPGIDFFILARRMTADGFYTSPVGMRDVYLGNSPQAAFTVPAASIDHVISRSPLK